MKKEKLLVGEIPTIVWGYESRKVVFVVHGSQSHKEDRFTQFIAKQLIEKGYQIISFDLPEHGERINKLPVNTIQQCINDMNTIMNHFIASYDEINLIACSLGAFLSLYAYAQTSFHRCGFLSPVIDLKELTNRLLQMDGVSIEQVKKYKEVILTNGIKVKLEDYEYLQENRIVWNQSVSILYGRKDALIPLHTIESFINRTNSTLLISEDSEHYFHTQNDMEMIKDWIDTLFSE